MTLLLGNFSENITLKLHVTFCRTSRVISPKLCHALFSMSRVKSGEFCHGQCHALFWGSKSVTGYFSCHGRFFRKLTRVSDKVSREKKNKGRSCFEFFLLHIALNPYQFWHAQNPRVPMTAYSEATRCPIFSEFGTSSKSIFFNIKSL